MVRQHFRDAAREAALDPASRNAAAGVGREIVERLVPTAGIDSCRVDRDAARVLQRAMRSHRHSLVKSNGGN